ncbi:LuxR C-terminal-related transcriptional regulator [Lentzea alba]|uniref:response regulator transcription factor n=1 Tax=Lentzea alba TaxID=2714351 RepID=UPI0039BF16D0
MKDLVMGAYALMASAGEDAERLLLRALKAARRAPGLEAVASMAETWLATLHLLTTCERALPVLRQLASQPDAAPPLADRVKLLSGVTMAFLEGPDAGLEALLEENTVGSPALVGMLRLVNGDLCRGRNDIDTAITSARRSGAVLGLPAHSLSSVASYLLGDWERALIDGLHGAVMAANQPLAAPFAYAIASWVPAGRGEWDRAEELLRAAEAAASELTVRCTRYTMPIIAIGRAVLAQARGDHQEMTRALEPVVTLPDAGMRKLTTAWWLPLHVEALIGIGDFGAAVRELTVLRGHSDRIKSLRLVTAWLAGRLAEARGDLSTAVASYRHGTVCDVGPDDVPLHRALLEDALGRMLESSAWSRSAARRLQELGADAFRQRLDRPMPEQRVRLSDREAGIMHLVGLGLTNREIAEKLFISKKTVEYHLTNLYARLNLPNRRHLRDLVQRQSYEPTARGDLRDTSPSEVWA